MLKKGFEVLAVFLVEPWKKMTFNQVKMLSKKTSKSYVYASLKEFVDKGVLKEEKVGNSVLYFLDLHSKLSQRYAGLIAEHLGWSKSHIPLKILQKLMRLIPTVFYTLIITGSYAKKKQRSDSDLDVVLIVDDAVSPKFVYAQIRQECELSIPKIHAYVFRKKEFLEMLMNNEANYGKEIAKNNILLVGGQAYFDIIGEAVLHGFDGTLVS